MNKTAKVFITSCEIAEGAWSVHEQKLKQLHELSDKKYSLTDDPALADIILIGNVREENWGRKILENKLINKYPNKCFSLSDQDAPLILNRGIYASGTKSILNLGRVRTGSFTSTCKSSYSFSPECLRKKIFSIFYRKKLSPN
jgi:hypothetical protein